MKQIASVITGLPEVRPEPTGTQAIVTGSARPPALPRPQSLVCKDDPKDELPPLVRATVPESTARLIEYLRFSREPVPAHRRARAREVLLKLQADLQIYKPPSDPADVITSLELVAKTLQVELPDEDGLMVYAAILSELPIAVLKQAVIEVCKTHKYPSMPKPADFLEAVRDQAWQWRWLHMGLDKWIKQLESD